MSVTISDADMQASAREGFVRLVKARVGVSQSASAAQVFASLDAKLAAKNVRDGVHPGQPYPASDDAVYDALFAAEPAHAPMSAQDEADYRALFGDER